MATRWGIVGSGRISNDFVNALGILPRSEHEVVCVAARDLSRAQEFARKHDIATAYGSYRELANDRAADVVYVGVTCPNHFDVVMMMLNAEKHVLCEKPFAINASQVKQMVALAREKKVFLMEAVWSRFFPSHERIRTLVKDGTIGEAKNIIMSFGQADRHLPGKRLTQKAQGGGSILDYGSYCIQFALMVFGHEKPKISATTVGLNDDQVDLGATVVLRFSGGRVATFVTDLRVELPCDATVSGSKGTLRVSRRFWCPTELTLSFNDSEDKQTEKFAMPQGAKFEFAIPNGQGLSFEAKEVRRCILEGLTESPTMSLDESVLIAEIEEEINEQIGVSFKE